MTSTSIAVLTLRALAVTTFLLSTLSITSCGDRSRRATGGDTGTAAPATVRDMSATPAAPNSTTSAAATTSRPPAAGDTVRASMKPGAKTATPAARPKY